MANVILCNSDVHNSLVIEDAIIRNNDAIMIQLWRNNDIKICHNDVIIHNNEYVIICNDSQYNNV